MSLQDMVPGSVDLDAAEAECIETAGQLKTSQRRALSKFWKLCHADWKQKQGKGMAYGLTPKDQNLL